MEEGRREWDTGGLEKLGRFDFSHFQTDALISNVTVV